MTSPAGEDHGPRVALFGVDAFTDRPFGGNPAMVTAPGGDDADFTSRNFAPVLGLDLPVSLVNVGANSLENLKRRSLISQHVNAPPPSIGVRRPELAGLDPVFATAMAKAPSGRFGSALESSDGMTPISTSSIAISA